MGIMNMRALFSLATATAVLALTACATRHVPPTPPSAVPAPAPPPAPSVPPAAAPSAARPPATVTPPFASSHVSNALTPLAYRRDAAGHLYAANAGRIYKGMLQPQLYAIGVLDVDIDRAGQVIAINWRRAPSHAPEVMAEIVRTVRAAAPYPAPARMGKVTYTDIWLWDKSGKFQLDTLTEGQL
jgi:protein TonB